MFPRMSVSVTTPTAGQAAGNLPNLIKLSQFPRTLYKLKKENLQESKILNVVMIKYMDVVRGGKNTASLCQDDNWINSD